jgi:DNA-binding NtrC family response regulator
VRAIDDDVWAMLEGYDWQKNNVRELERVIERIMVWVDDSDRITMDIVSRSRALPEEVLRAVGAQPDAEASVRQVITGGVGLDELFAMHWVDAREHVLEHFGQAYAMHHLVKASYNLTVAAEAAGMQRPNFSRFVKERGIDVEKLKEQKLRG